MIEPERNVILEEFSTSNLPDENEYSSQDFLEEDSTSSETFDPSADNQENGSTNSANLHDSPASFILRDVEQLNQFVFNKMNSEGAPVEERKPLVSFSTELAPINLADPNMDLDTVEDYFLKLRSERLIFISCANDQLALQYAHAIVGRLDLTNPGQRRYLDFRRTTREKCGPSIDLLRNVSKKQELDDLAVVIDAVSEPAQGFLDDLLDATDAALVALHSQLEGMRLFFVCIVNNEDVVARLTHNDRSGSFQRESPIAHLNIPFLKPLLRRHFPNEYEDLESKIMAVRDRWDPDDRKFRFRIEALIRSGQLKGHLSSEQPGEASVQPAELFLGDNSARDYVVYVAVHFPGLNPREFQRVVSFLLQDKTTTVTVSTTIKLEDGKVEKIDVEKERSLLEIWRASMDKVHRDSQLITSPAEDARTIVDFRNHRTRQQLKEQLNLEYSAFLTTQFEHLLNNGLLFDQSVRIAKNFEQLMAEMIAADREYYGYEWICGLLTKLESRNDDATLEPERQAELFPTLSGMTVRQTRSVIYYRLAGLIRELLNQQAQELVNELFEQLIRGKLHQSALELVKRLRFVPQFEEFYWLRQLIERGDKATTEKTFIYLCFYLQSTGARVYSVLDGLDEWINKDARPEIYSRAAEEALQLIFFYCSSLRLLDSSLVSTHPFFTFRDAESARLNLGLVTRSLFHPWMERSIHNLKPGLRVLASIGEFISGWVFGILRRIDERDAAVQPQPNTGLLSPAETVRILLQQVAVSSNREQQDRLVRFWKSKSIRLKGKIIDLPYGTAGRDELIARRNTLEEMIAQFVSLIPVK